MHQCKDKGTHGRLHTEENTSYLRLFASTMTLCMTSTLAKKDSSSRQAEEHLRGSIFQRRNSSPSSQSMSRKGQPQVSFQSEQERAAAEHHRKHLGVENKEVWMSKEGLKYRFKRHHITEKWARCSIVGMKIPARCYNAIFRIWHKGLTYIYQHS